MANVRLRGKATRRGKFRPPGEIRIAPPARVRLQHHPEVEHQRVLHQRGPERLQRPSARRITAHFPSHYVGERAQRGEHIVEV